MAASTSTGSPAPRGTQTDRFTIHEEGDDKLESPLHRRQTSLVYLPIVLPPQ